jgi:hypothetical protein
MTSNNWKSQFEISKKELRLILFIDPEKPCALALYVPRRRLREGL